VRDDDRHLEQGVRVMFITHRERTDAASSVYFSSVRDRAGSPLCA